MFTTGTKPVEQNTAGSRFNVKSIRLGFLVRLSYSGNAELKGKEVQGL